MAVKNTKPAILKSDLSQVKATHSRTASRMEMPAWAVVVSPLVLLQQTGNMGRQ